MPSFPVLQNRPSASAAVLIATLGSEPQVIALAAQLLTRADEPLTSVRVLHTLADHPPIAEALPALTQAFAQHPAWPRLRTVPVPTADVLTPAQIEEFGDHLYQTLQTWVASTTRVHLLLAGGRKSMAMVGMTVAQLLLGPDDRVWYLHSDDDLRTSRRFTLQPDDTAQLIQVPLPQLTPAPPVYTRPFRATTPAAALRALEDEQQRLAARRGRGTFDHDGDGEYA